MNPRPNQPTLDVFEGVHAAFRSPDTKASAERDVRVALKPKPKIPDKGFLMLSVGAMADMSGLQCKLHHINRGKRRLTFTFGETSDSCPEVSDVGTIVKIFGVPCKLVHVDQKKRRIAFTPARSVQRMPVAAVSDPIHRVKR